MGNQSLILPLTKRFKYRPLSSITTEMVKRNDCCSGLRKRNPGSAAYHRPTGLRPGREHANIVKYKYWGAYEWLPTKRSRAGSMQSGIDTSTTLLVYCMLVFQHVRAGMSAGSRGVSELKPHRAILYEKARYVKTVNGRRSQKTVGTGEHRYRLRWIWGT